MKYAFIYIGEPQGPGSGSPVYLLEVKKKRTPQGHEAALRYDPRFAVWEKVSLSIGEFQEVSQPFRLSLSRLAAPAYYRISDLARHSSASEARGVCGSRDLEQQETFPARRGRYEPPTPMVMGILLDD